MCRHKVKNNQKLEILQYINFQKSVQCKKCTSYICQGNFIQKYSILKMFFLDFKKYHIAHNFSFVIKPTNIFVKDMSLVPLCYLAI